MRAIRRRYQARMVSGLATQATGRGATPQPLADFRQSGALWIGETQTRRKMGSEDAILGDQVLILEEEALVHQARHVCQQPRPLVIPHGQRTSYVVSGTTRSTSILTRLRGCLPTTICSRDCTFDVSRKTRVRWTSDPELPVQEDRAALPARAGKGVRQHCYRGPTPPRRTGWCAVSLGLLLLLSRPATAWNRWLATAKDSTASGSTISTRVCFTWRDGNAEDVEITKHYR